MNFYHGISAVNGRPYSAPVAIRAVLKSEGFHDARTHNMHQGYCGQCGYWVDLQAKQPLLVPELKVSFMFIIVTTMLCMRRLNSFVSVVEACSEMPCPR